MKGIKKIYAYNRATAKNMADYMSNKNAVLSFSLGVAEDGQVFFSGTDHLAPDQLKIIFKHILYNLDKKP